MQGGIVLTLQPKWLQKLGNTSDGVYVVDAAQRIIYWNKAATRILGYSEAEVLGQDCHRVIAGRRCDRAWCHANCLVRRKVLHGTLPTDFDLLSHTKQGEDIWLNISIMVLSRGGKFLVLHMFRDVTRRKRNEERINHALSLLGISNVPLGKPKKHAGAIHSSTYRGEAIAALSRREIECLRLLAEGLSSGAIADRLGISVFTARNHIRNCLRKLGLHSKAQAVSFAFRKGLL